MNKKVWTVVASAALVGALSSGIRAEGVAAGDKKQADESFIAGVIKNARSVLESRGASSASVPAAKGRPAAPSIDELVSKKMGVVFADPNFKGTRFLALSAQESHDLSDEEKTRMETKRARIICRYLGFDEPTFSKIKPDDGGGDLMALDESGNAVTQKYPSLCWGKSCVFGIDEDGYSRFNGVIHDPAHFSLLGCRKRSR